MWRRGVGAAAVGPAARRRLPTVQVMVVGQGGVVLAGPRTVTGAAATVTAVARRHCAIRRRDAAGGPGRPAPPRRARLLVARLRPLRLGGPQLRAAVRLSIGGETNRGQNGWEYKVGGLSGTTGAADPSGVRGDGRLLRSGQRVLWFWCEASAGGCQRTLEVSASVDRARSGTLAVQVTGYDNEGRGAPGGRSASSSSAATSRTTGSLRPGEPDRTLLVRALHAERDPPWARCRPSRRRSWCGEALVAPRLGLLGCVRRLAGCGLGAGPAPDGCASCW